MCLKLISQFGDDEGVSLWDQNLVVHGENLAFISQAAETLWGRFKLIYLDPPYNTGNRFEHYDDVRTSDQWLAFMRERLMQLRPLLRDDGILVVQINDEEQAHLQVMMDDVFGRHSRLNTVVVKMSELSGVKMTHAGPKLPRLKEYLLIYGITEASRLNAMTVPKPEHRLERYLKYYTKIIENIEDPPERWSVVPIREFMKKTGRSVSREAIRALQLTEKHRVVYRTNNAFLSELSFEQPIVPVTSPTGREYIWWEGKEMLFLENHCDEVLGDLWTDISTINLNKEGIGSFRNGKKPEALMRRIVELTTMPGDWILDPFGGSGTTAATAHRLHRRWITTESEVQVHTHITPRLQQVVEEVGCGGFSVVEM